ncbi:hypothetical protein [Parapedobacter sp. 2B3]|uniref:hypothetical protein n=1 Tax=Parapedobacter sp. 2B3 TaxID=3342381 RepID=UPI0035B5B113
MSKLFADNEVSVFSTECSLTYSSFIYCMMLNRMAWGYSAQELSFLLGQDDDFVPNLERFKRFDMGVELYGQLCKVFRHASFIQHQHHGEKELRHEMHIWKAGETIFYRMECYKSQFESITLFQLSEEDPEIGKYRYKNSVTIYQQQSLNALYTMLTRGLFDKPIEAQELYRRLDRMSENIIDPIYFKTALYKLVGRKGKAPLKRTKQRSYSYRYALHPGVDLEAATDFVHQKFHELS